MIEATFVSPVLFTIFGFKLYSYGLMIALALGSCTWCMACQLGRLKIDADASTFMLAFIPGFWIGSKAQMVISAQLTGSEMPNLSIESGHSFMGSAIGGVLCAGAYGYTCGLRPLQLLDLIAPLVPLGHGIGKWGCFLAGDGCYGPEAPAWLPWAMSFPNGGVPTRQFVHPTPLYESILSLLLFVFVHFGMAVPVPSAESRSTQPVGRRAALTIGLYGLERMVIEPWRRHTSLTSDYLMGLTEFQFLAVMFVLLGGVITILGRRSIQWGAGAAAAGDGTAAAGDAAKLAAGGARKKAEGKKSK